MRETGASTNRPETLLTTLSSQAELKTSFSSVEAEAQSCEALTKRFDVLGVRVNSISFKVAIECIQSWIEGRTGTRIVTFTNVHAVMEARRDETFCQVLNQADMVCPDGMPLVWLDHLGGGSTERLCGPDFMAEFFRQTEGNGYRHFFYGGAPAVVERLAVTMQSRFTGVRIAGFYSPPYRTLTAEEDKAVVQMINSATPDLLWVGLGCPKQERWMSAHREAIHSVVMLGVGQAFDIHGNALAQAPRWMRDHGLEWIFRVCSEPRRLWKRYLVTNTGFVLTLVPRLFSRIIRRR
ncbi:MAG: WecB/TagA/CpsF family glycosyltransferase [Candidatus Korobacteraceae bacterium]|jgi:N-acetylglucosaminyldiphosphoundecaprenol N-acetyl-beta-D-mannosaminyltransferase